jgi:hypothetical protein
MHLLDDSIMVDKSGVTVLRMRCGYSGSALVVLLSMCSVVLCYSEHYCAVAEGVVLLLILTICVYE